jgi:hypothetical protein
MTRPGQLLGSRCLRRIRRDGHTAQASQSYLTAQISLLCASSLLRTELPLGDQNGGSDARLGVTAQSENEPEPALGDTAATTGVPGDAASSGPGRSAASGGVTRVAEDQGSRAPHHGEIGSH